jgi:hypothetical protein
MPLVARGAAERFPPHVSNAEARRCSDKDCTTKTQRTQRGALVPVFVRVVSL